MFCFFLSFCYDKSNIRLFGNSNGLGSNLLLSPLVQREMTRSHFSDWFTLKGLQSIYAGLLKPACMQLQVCFWDKCVTSVFRKSSHPQYLALCYIIIVKSDTVNVQIHFVFLNDRPTVFYTGCTLCKSEPKLLWMFKQHNYDWVNTYSTSQWNVRFYIFIFYELLEQWLPSLQPWL